MWGVARSVLLTSVWVDGVVLCLGTLRTLDAGVVTSMVMDFGLSASSLSATAW